MGKDQRLMMDPVVYAMYLYFLIVSDKDSNENDEDGLKRINAIKVILNTAKNPAYKERMTYMFSRIGSNHFLLSVEDIDACIQ